KMNRKNFLSSLLALGAARPVLAASNVSSPHRQDASAPGMPPHPAETALPLLIPPYLRPGDTIGITCPAGDITAKDIESAVQMIESWGFRIKTGDTVGKKDFIFGGTDEERAADFQQMLRDPELSAILCARGGYGAVHIVDQLDFSSLTRRPKW